MTVPHLLGFGRWSRLVIGHGDGGRAVLHNGDDVLWRMLEGLAPSDDDSGQMRLKMQPCSRLGLRNPDIEKGNALRKRTW
jgi:hypothetical protein